MRPAFHFSNGADVGGTICRSVVAFARHPERGWTMRGMVASDNYIRYPHDLEYDDKLLMDTYDAAEVVLMNSVLYGHWRYDNGQGKPTVLVHHGVHKGHFSQDVYQAVEEAKE